MCFGGLIYWFICYKLKHKINKAPPLRSYRIYMDQLCRSIDCSGGKATLVKLLTFKKF